MKSNSDWVIGLGQDLQQQQPPKAYQKHSLRVFHTSFPHHSSQKMANNLYDIQHLALVPLAIQEVKSLNWKWKKWKTDTANLERCNTNVNAFSTQAKLCHFILFISDNILNGKQYLPIWSNMFFSTTIHKLNYNIFIPNSLN